MMIIRRHPIKLALIAIVGLFLLTIILSLVEGPPPSSSSSSSSTTTTVDIKDAAAFNKLTADMNLYDAQMKAEEALPACATTTTGTITTSTIPFPNSKNMSTAQMEAAISAKIKALSTQLASEPSTIPCK